MNVLPSSCPICNNEEIAVTGFFCRECDTRFEGRFLLSSPFADLSPEQLRFVETFVLCEGKFNRMESELEISYPTIRSRLHEIIRALGHEPGKDSGESRAGDVSEEERREVLAALESGTIDYNDALRILNGE